MANTPKDNTGRVFDNKQRRTSEKQPAYTGTAMVNGTLMKVAVWHYPPSNTKKATLFMTFKDYEDHLKEQAQRRHDASSKRPGSAPIPSPDWQDVDPF